MADVQKRVLPEDEGQNAFFCQKADYGLWLDPNAILPVMTRQIQAQFSGPEAFGGRANGGNK
jgi:hypothetical protein